MKLSEFEERLSTVSDGKLRAMYADSKANGPAVAAELILAEAGRRGLDLDAAPAPGEPSPDGAPTASSPTETGDGLSPEVGLDAASGEGVPKGAWLAEETSGGGLPMPVKILLAVAILGGLGAIAFMALGRG